MKRFRWIGALVVVLGLPACYGSTAYVGVGYGGYGGYPGWGYPTPGVIPPPYVGRPWYDDADDEFDLDTPATPADATATGAPARQ